MMGARGLEKMASWLLHIIVSVCAAFQGSPSVFCLQPRQHGAEHLACGGTINARLMTVMQVSGGRDLLIS